MRLIVGNDIHDIEVRKMNQYGAPKTRIRKKTSNLGEKHSPYPASFREFTPSMCYIRKTLESCSNIYQCHSDWLQKDKLKQINPFTLNRKGNIFPIRIEFAKR